MLLSTLLLSALSLCWAAESLPHIVMILVDDWGWANVGYHNGNLDPDIALATENIDALVADGIELNQHYTHSVCGPTRASLLSGRMPSNVNIDNGFCTAYSEGEPIAGGVGIPPAMTTLPEKLKRQGYKTHVVGKWDAGMATPKQIPQGRHFDSSLVFFNHMNDMYTMEQGSCPGHGKITDFWEDDWSAKDKVNGTYEEELFKNRVLHIINDHNEEEPLFLYYPTRVVHTPLQVPQEYLDLFSEVEPEDRRHYYAMVKFLDDAVGSIREALVDNGMWNNTLLVMSSDNGGPLYPSGGANNYPLKGSKTSNWQGGIRVNAFVSGGFIPPKMRGSTIDEYIHVCDWYATFCDLAGALPFDARAAAAGLRAVDSLNMWPLLSGQTATSPRTEMFFAPQFYFNTIFPNSNGVALIEGDYKILLGVNPWAGWTAPISPNASHPKPQMDSKDCGFAVGCLYDIKNDPYEEDDLAHDSSMFEILNEMRMKALEYNNTMYIPDRGAFANPEACVYALDDYDKTWGPFVNVPEIVPPE